MYEAGMIEYRALKDRVAFLEERLNTMGRERWEQQTRMLDLIQVKVESEVLFTAFKALTVLQALVTFGLILYRLRHG